MNELAAICREAIKNFPNLREEIKDTYALAECEIEDGESIENEVELAIASLKDMGVI